MKALKCNKGASYLTVVLIVLASLGGAGMMLSKKMGLSNLTVQKGTKSHQKSMDLDAALKMHAQWYRQNFDDAPMDASNAPLNCSNAAVFSDTTYHYSPASGDPIYSGIDLICETINTPDMQGYMFHARSSLKNGFENAKLFVPYRVPIAEVTLVTNPGDTSRSNPTLTTLPSVIAVGTPIYRDDIVTTGASSIVRVVTKDGSSFNVGNDSEFVFTDYNDKVTKGQEQGVYTLIRGIVRAVFEKSGEGYELRTETAAMGIRGTEVIAQAGADPDNASKYNSVFTLVQGGGVEMFTIHPKTKAKNRLMDGSNHVTLARVETPNVNRVVMIQTNRPEDVSETQDVDSDFVVKEAVDANASDSTVEVDSFVKNPIATTENDEVKTTQKLESLFTSVPKIRTISDFRNKNSFWKIFKILLVSNLQVAQGGGAIDFGQNEGQAGGNVGLNPGNGQVQPPPPPAPPVVMMNRCIKYERSHMFDDWDCEDEKSVPKDSHNCSGWDCTKDRWWGCKRKERTCTAF